MAEVPLPIPTQAPVPSTDIRNAVFAGAKLDEEVTGAGEFYIDRLGVKHLTNAGRNNHFNAAQQERTNQFQQFLLSSGYVFLGDYEDGPFQFSARNQYIRYDNQYYRLNASTDIGFTTTGTDATSFANDVTHFVLMDGDTLRQNLGSGEEGLGDALLAVKQPFNGAVARTQHDKNAEIISVKDFGAVVGKDNDSTSAFDAATAAYNPTYVPRGDWHSGTNNALKFYGPGYVYSTYAEDGLFNDNGRRVISPFPQTGEPIWLMANSRGNYERGAGVSITFNKGIGGRPNIMGFNDDSRQSSYVNHDAAALCIESYGPQNQQTLTNCTFTATTFSSDDLTEEVAANIEIGMFCVLTSGTSYKARILDVDVDTKTITVSGWYPPGDNSAGQIPTDGLSVRTNSVTKLWGQVTIVFINNDSSVATATGYELGFQISKSPGNPIWGFHAVNYSDTYYGNHAFRATGLWRTGLYFGPTVQSAVEYNVNSGSGHGLTITDTTEEGWTGSALRVNTNYRSTSSYLLNLVSGGTSYFNIDTQGRRSLQKERLVNVSSAATITGLTNSFILCTNTSAMELTLSTANFVTGQMIKFRASGGGEVTVSGYTLNSTNGRYLELIYNGSGFSLVQQGD